MDKNSKQIVVLLPVTGYFAHDYKGERVEYRIPKRPGIELDSFVRNQLKNEPPRQLKSVLLNILDAVRQRGRPFDSSLVADDWLQAEGMIEPTEYCVDDPMYGHVIFRVTDKGNAFLRGHEAPEY